MKCGQGSWEPGEARDNFLTPLTTLESYINARLEMSPAQVFVSAEPVLPAVAAVLKSGCLSSPPQELGPVELPPLAG